MPFRRIALLAALAVAALTPTLAAAAPAGHLRVATYNAATFPDYSLTANRNQYVVLKASQTDQLHALKAANPNVKVLLYQNASAIYSNCTASYCSSAVDYATADASHPEWFLLNTNGSRFTFNGYTYLWAADVGNAAYQNAWASRVIAKLQGDSWDGVFMDDVNYSISSHYDPAGVAKYPTDALYGAAMRSLVANVAPKVIAAGKLAIANMQWGTFPSQSNDWLQFLSGAMDEKFVKWGFYADSGYADANRWRTDVANVKYAEQEGKIVLAITQSAADDRQAALYGWATLLLAAGGHSYFTLAPDYATETWFPEYDYAIGDPVGSETTDSAGLHMRQFANGLVVVNPTTSTLTASFGAPYSGSGLSAASSATLAPRTGLVLTKDPVAAPEPAPAPAPAPAGAPAPDPVVANVLAIPTGLTAIAGDRKVRLSWSPVPGATGYRVYRNLQLISSATTASSYTDSGLTNGLPYVYAVSAIDAAGDISGLSASVTATPFKPRRGVKGVAASSRCAARHARHHRRHRAHRRAARCRA